MADNIRRILISEKLQILTKQSKNYWQKKKLSLPVKFKFSRPLFPNLLIINNIILPV